VSDFDPKRRALLHQGVITALACWLAAIFAFALHLNSPWWASISAWVIANPERQELLGKAANRIFGTVVGCFLDYWLALEFEGRSVLLPSLPQIVISSLVVLNREAASTHFRGLERILGCFAGGLSGLVAIRLAPSSFFVWSAMLLLGIFLFAMLHHSTSRWSYLGIQGGVALILALITGGGPPGSIMPAANRIAGMLCGVGILICVCFVCGHPGNKPAQSLREPNTAA
jgi:uncharacterized membrane protein YccC